MARARRFEAGAVPEPVEITGPWEVRFAPGAGAPERVTLDRLISWSQHSDSGVRYYLRHGDLPARQFNVPAGLIAPGRRLYLDLGRVEVMAGVKLNGKDLGILWKEPYCVEVTDALKPGENALEVAGRQSLDQPADRGRATARGQRAQSQRHAQAMAAMAAGRQAQPHRPLHLHKLAAVAEGLAAGGIRPAWPGEGACHAEGCPAIEVGCGSESSCGRAVARSVWSASGLPALS